MNGVVVRTVFALAAVLLVMWLCARVLRKTSGGRPTDVIEVVGRQQLTKASSVAVVRIADRAYLLGVTDQRVELIAETHMDAVRPVVAAPREVRTPVAAPLSLVASVPASLALPTPLPVPAATAVPVSAAVPATATAVRDIVPESRPGGMLAGSALSLTTWRSGMQELRERSVRRP